MLGEDIEDRQQYRHNTEDRRRVLPPTLEETHRISPFVRGLTDKRWDRAPGQNPASGWTGLYVS